jgi:hypothetical protein
MPLHGQRVSVGKGIVGRRQLAAVNVPVVPGGAYVVSGGWKAWWRTTLIVLGSGAEVEQRARRFLGKGGVCKSRIDRVRHLALLYPSGGSSQSVGVP